MARTIDDIKNAIIGNIQANENLAQLNSTSKAAMYRLFVYVIAFAIWTLEFLFDKHAVEVDDKLFNQKSGRPSWYRTMALQFQYGFDLVPDKDYYDNGTATDEQIEASKIIKYAAVNEADDESRLINSSC